MTAWHDQQVGPARVAAHRVLRAVHQSGRDLATALDSARRELNDPRDRALAGEIALGTLRWRNAIDHLLAGVSSRPLTRISPPILDLLRAATYQMHWLDRIPAHAVVADTVTLARIIGRPRGAGFVNAVLRAMTDVRPQAALPRPAAPSACVPVQESPEGAAFSREATLAYLSITLSHPRWLAARWLDRHGLDAAVAWARFNNHAAPITLRPNLSQISTLDLATALARHDVETTPAEFAPHGLVVKRGDPAATPLAAGGAFVIQDEASQLIVELVSPPAGSMVLDLCASPGNKTAGLAAQAAPAASAVGSRHEGTGLIVACDHRPYRVALLDRTRERLRLSNVSVVRLDATAPLPFARLFDRVLVDAPCSGLGTIRRDPDIKWRRAAEDLDTFADRQLAMLKRAAACVRPGGQLIYATCSSEPEENERVASRFLKTHASFSLVRPESPVVASFLDKADHFRTLPFRDGVDAFFGAVLRRRDQ